MINMINDFRCTAKADDDINETDQDELSFNGWMRHIHCWSERTPSNTYSEKQLHQANESPSCEVKALLPPFSCSLSTFQYLFASGVDNAAASLIESIYLSMYGLR